MEFEPAHYIKPTSSWGSSRQVRAFQNSSLFPPGAFSAAFTLRRNEQKHLSLSCSAGCLATTVDIG